MATFPNSQSGQNDYQTIKRSSDRRVQGRKVREAWELRLGAKQLISLWAFICVTMFVVFLFGFQAGRERGLVKYLEENAREPVRLPVLAQAPMQDVVHGNYNSIAATQVENVEMPSAPVHVASAAAPLAGSSAAPIAESPLEKIPDARASLGSKIKTEDLAVLKLKSSPSEQKVETTVAANPVNKIEEKTLPPLLMEPAPTSAGAALGSLESKDSVKPEVTSEPKEAKTEISKVIEPKETSAKAQIANDKTSQKLATVSKKAPAPAEVKQAQTTPAKSKAVIKASSKGTTSVQQNPSRGWYIQLAAKKTVEDAMEVVGAVSSAGSKTVVQPAQVRNTNYYRVLVGPFSDKKAAQSAQDKISGALTPGISPFIKEIQ